MYKHTKIISFLFIATFCFFIFFWKEKAERDRNIALTTQTDIITKALWNLSFEQIRKYLELSAKFNNYERVSIYTAEENAPAIEITGPTATKCDKILMKIGVVSKINISQPIYKNGENIGRFEAVEISVVFYKVLYTFLIGLILWVVVMLFCKIIKDKHTLEDRVAERTKELRQSENNLQITLNSIGDAVIATDVNGDVVQMNPNAEKLTGWTLSDASGKKLPDIFHIVNAKTRIKCESPVEKVLKVGKVVELANHTLLISKNGTEYQIADSGSPIRTEEGNIVGVVLVFRDVTEEYQLNEKLKKSEILLRQTEKMESIGQLAGGIAHDFNNMLGGILGAAELLEIKGLVTDKGSKEMLNLIITTAKRAADLTSKLLTFSRQGELQSTLFNINDIINDTVSLLKRSVDKQINIIMDFKATKHHIIGDPSQIQNAFLNLCINARDAMPNGGTLTIHTNNIELDDAYCSASPFEIMNGEYLEISIRDTGFGMSIDTQNKIFEPFFTTKEQGKGTGLGLAAVYGTVCLHHGAITVYSEENNGTVFHIYLPAKETTKKNLKSSLENKEVNFSESILVIDDEKVIRTTAQLILSDLGFSVMTANDGVDGIQLFKEKHKEIDLVLLDMIMPRMGGTETFYELQKIDPNVKIIMASGFTKDASIGELKKNGLQDFISKPYSRNKLLQVVSEALRKSTS